jgi:phage replication initiation protein
MADYETREQYFSAYQDFWLRQVAAPDNNMGGIKLDHTVIDRYSNGKILESDGLEHVYLMPKGKKGKSELIRVPSKNSKVKANVAHVDQCTFTIKIDSLLSRWVYFPYDQEKGYLQQKAFNPDYIGNMADIIPRLSSTLYSILGIPITTPRPTGMNFYKYSWELGDKDGVVMYGGNRDTVCVHLTGQACLKARAGWQGLLHDFLKIHEARITRIDLAADLFDGGYTPDQARSDYHSGLFTLRAQKPFAECRGGGWENEADNSGKTFYVGKRENGKLLRVYEKGLQILGKLITGAIEGLPGHVDYAKWVRAECEFHAVDRILPYDMLLEPGRYLAGAYPALSWLSDLQEKIRTFKKVASATVERAVQNTKNAVGKTLWALSELYGVEQTFKMLTEGKEILPRWAGSIVPAVGIDDPLAESWEKEMDKVPF